MNFSNLNLFNKPIDLTNKTIVIVATENQTIFEIYDDKNECTRYEVLSKINTITDLKDIQPKDKKGYSCILNDDFFKKVNDIPTPDLLDLTDVPSSQTSTSNNPFDNEVINPIHIDKNVSKGGFTKKKQPRDKYGRFIKNLTYKNRKK